MNCIINKYFIVIIFYFFLFDRVMPCHRLTDFVLGSAMKNPVAKSIDIEEDIAEEDGAVSPSGTVT
jgi:hypothetical protein